MTTDADAGLLHRVVSPSGFVLEKTSDVQSERTSNADDGGKKSIQAGRLLRGLSLQVFGIVPACVQGRMWLQSVRCGVL